MEIIETSVFTRAIRKLRWSREGRGKRGGARVIYYYVADDNQIYMLAAYAEGRKADLTPKELALLRKLVQEELS